jgi:hypothetical protein
MAIRNVPKSYTFEQQRQEINNIAADIGDFDDLIFPATPQTVVGAINTLANALSPNSGLFLSGTTDPDNATGLNGDFYLNTVTEELWGPKANNVWPDQPINFKGILYGEDVPDSTVGVDGAFYLKTDTRDLFGPKTNGSWSLAAISLSEQLLSGSGAPDPSLGKVNDFYIDLLTRDLYGPKTVGGWTAPLSLSNQILSGVVAPLSATGKEGDFYIDLVKRDLYGPKTGNSWGTPIPLGEEEIGTVIFVKPDGDDTRSGLSVRNSVKTLKQACKIAQNTNGNITIRMFSGDYYEDNPIYVPKGTSIVGDNLRETIIRPKNEGEDFLWVTSGTYINYLVIRDNYGNPLDSNDTSRGVGYLNTGSNREISASETTFDIFPGHNLTNVGGIYKDASNIVTYKKVDIVEYAYDEMLIQYPGLVIPGGTPEETCKRDIGYFVDAVIHDLRHGGNVKTVQFAEAYFNAAGNLESIVSELAETIYALEKVKEIASSYIQSLAITQEVGYLTLFPPVISGSCTGAVNFVDTLTDIAISVLNGGDAPRINAGPGYILVNQEWMRVEEINGNVVTIQDRAVDDPVTGDETVAARHISGSVITQGARAWRYAVTYPDQDGIRIRGRLNFNTISPIVNGTGTDFTVECFVGGFLKVGANTYKIASIQSSTQLTLVQNPLVQVVGAKSTFVPPKERIFLSPYTQNCSAISVLGKSYYDSATKAYDARKTRGGGMLVDGDQLEPNTPIKSMVVDAFTQVVSGGVGFHMKNDGYSQLVSIFQVFEDVGVLAESGGYASITNSATNFGVEGLKAVGYSPNPYPFFIGNVSNVQNITKSSFNASPSPILSSEFTREGTSSVIRMKLNMAAVDMGKYEVGQVIDISGHVLPNPGSITNIFTLSSYINSTALEINRITLSDNTIEILISGVPWNNVFTGLQGGQTGTLTITSGSTYTAFTVTGFDAIPLANYIIRATGLPLHPSGLEYVVDTVLEYVPDNYTIITTQLKVPDAVVSTIANNAAVELRAPSTVNSSGHTFEYVGAGINYTALPQNGGRAITENNFVETESGKTYVSATDQDGNFFVGPYFKVDLRTGKATFSGAVALGVLDEIQLKGSPGVPIYEFSTDDNLGGTVTSKNTALPTQKAVREYINKPSVLGNLIGLNKGTTAAPGLLVQLDGSGKINADQLPPAPPATVYTVADETARLDLSTTNPGIIVTDLCYQVDTGVTYILTGLPTTIPANWQVFSGTNINASNIISGTISPARLGSGVANDSSFLSGLSKYVPATQGLRPGIASPMLVGGTTDNVSKTGSPIAVSNVTYNAGLQKATLTTTENHGLVTNDWVEVENIFPYGWNGYHQVTRINDTTVTYSLTFNPGTYVDGGFITKGTQYESGFTELDIQRSSFFNGQTAGSSTVGVVRYDYKTFDINPSSELLLREKGVELGKIENIRRRSLLGNSEFPTLGNTEGNVTELGLGEDVEQVSVFTVSLQSGNYRINDRINDNNLGDFPALSLVAGKSYKFGLNVPGEPFYITTSPRDTIIPPNLPPASNYTTGVKVTDREIGNLFFTVPYNAPRVLYYQSGSSPNKFGVIIIGGYNDTGIKFTNAFGPTAIDSFPVTQTNTCKYLIQVNRTANPGDIHSTEIMLMHNSTNVYMTEYASLIVNSTSLGTFAGEINSNVVNLLFTPNPLLADANLTVKIKKVPMF